MKKFLCLVLAAVMLLSMAIVTNAAEGAAEEISTTEERQLAAEKIREKRLVEREIRLQNAKPRVERQAVSGDESTLFAAATAFKEDVTITLPLYDSVCVEFKTPLTTWPDFYGYLVDSDGNEVDAYVEVWADYAYDDEGYEYYPGVQISYIDEWSLDKGEYELYIEDYGTGKVYGPVTVLNPGYEFYGVLRTGRLSYLEYGFINYVTAVPELIDIALVNESGKTVYSVNDVGLDYSYEYGFSVCTYVPTSVPNGEYTVETTLYYPDGTKEELIPSKITVGDYAYVSNVSVINRYFTKDTETIYVEVNYGGVPIDLSEYEVVIYDGYGEAVATSQDCHIVEIYLDNMMVLYTVEVNSLTDYAYDVVVEYSGDKAFYLEYTESIYNADGGNAYYNVGKTKWVSDTEYLAMTSGMDAGEYTVYSDYMCTTAVGTLTVEADGSGRILLNSAYTRSNVYLNWKDDTQNVYLDRYNRVKSELYIASVTPGFISSGVKSITGFKFAISDYAVLTAEEIGDVTLVYNGSTVAKATNIEAISQSSYHTNGAKYVRTNFSADFSLSKTLSAGSSVTLVAETAYGTAQYEIPVVSSSDSTYEGYSVGVNGVYVTSRVIPMDPYDSVVSEYCDIITGEDIDFSISNINRTSFNVELYQYNEKDYSFEKVKTVKSSSLTKTQQYGYAYLYTGTLSNLDPGYYYIKLDDKRSAIFCVTDEPMIYTYGNYIEYYGGDITYYFDTVNVSSSDTIKAYYYNASGTKKTITTSSEINEGYAYITLKLGSIDFDNLTVYITCDGTVASTLKVYDMSDAENTGWVNYQPEGDELYIGFYADVVENPVLVVHALDEVYLTNIYGEKVLEKKLDMDGKNFIIVNVASLGLEDGEYAAYVMSGDAIITGSDVFGVRAAQAVTKPDITVDSVAVTSSRVTATIKNNTDKAIKNIELVVAGYNAEGIMVGAKTKAITSISAGKTSSPYVTAIKGAETYEVFVWDGVDTMVPLSR